MAIDSSIKKPISQFSWGQDSYAIDTLELEVRDKNDLFVSTMLRKAIRNIEKDNYRTAEQLLRQALEQAPDHPECLAYLAICLAASQRRYVTAEKLAKQVIVKHPYSAQGYYALGRVNLLGARRKEAFRLFARANKLVLGNAEMETELRKVDPRRSPVIRSLPRNHALNIHLGKLRYRLGKSLPLRLALVALPVLLAAVVIAMLK
jgi:tetratricopeptide (TPR) repeat protein